MRQILDWNALDLLILFSYFVFDCCALTHLISEIFSEWQPAQSKSKKHTQDTLHPLTSHKYLKTTKDTRLPFLANQGPWESAGGPLNESSVQVVEHVIAAILSTQ